MSASHHPGEDVLLAHAAGGLDAGLALVVASHLYNCAGCSDTVAALEAVGGALLAELSPAPMSPEATARAMAAIDVPLPSHGNRNPSRLSPRLPSDLTLPAPLTGHAIGRWRWLAPGIRWSRVHLPDDATANVVLIRGRPGSLIPAHGHRGTEFTQVLTGAIAGPEGRYAAGDLFTADETTSHHLQVCDGEECICLSALTGKLAMHGILARVLMPIVGP